jgi:uncharacterized protein (TIGR02001 family)
MKKFLVGLFALAVIGAGFAPSAQAAAELGGGAYVGVFDKYLWRGFNLSDSNVVVQPGVDLSVAGFTLSLWGNYNTDTDKLDEVDVSLDYTADLSDLVWMSVGNVYYNLDGAENTNELYLAVGVNTLLNPVIAVYYDWDEADSDGLFFTALVGHTVDLIDSVSLNLSALISYNQASDYSVGAYRDWHNYELGLSLDYAVTDQIVITPSLLYSSGISSAAKQAIDSEILGGINLSYTF